MFIGQKNYTAINYWATESIDGYFMEITESLFQKAFHKNLRLYYNYVITFI